MSNVHEKIYRNIEIFFLGKKHRDVRHWEVLKNHNSIYFLQWLLQQRDFKKEKNVQSSFFFCQISGQIWVWYLAQRTPLFKIKLLSDPSSFDHNKSPFYNFKIIYRTPKKTLKGTWISKTNNYRKLNKPMK